MTKSFIIKGQALASRVTPLPTAFAATYRRIRAHRYKMLHLIKQGAVNECSRQRRLLMAASPAIDFTFRGVDYCSRFFERKPK